MSRVLCATNFSFERAALWVSILLLLIDLTTAVCFCLFLDAMQCYHSGVTPFQTKPNFLQLKIYHVLTFFYLLDSSRINSFFLVFLFPSIELHISTLIYNMRFLSLPIVAAVFPIYNAWGKCVKYHQPWKIFEMSSICDKFMLTSHNRLVHLPTKSCVVPENISNNSKLTLDASCDHINSVFRQTPDLQLKHVSSGMCIYPTGAVSNPPVGTDLVINENCHNGVQRILQMDSGNHKLVTSVALFLAQAEFTVFTTFSLLKEENNYII